MGTVDPAVAERLARAVEMAREAGRSAGAAERFAAKASLQGGTDLMSPLDEMKATTPAHEKPMGTAFCIAPVCPTTRFFA